MYVRERDGDLKRKREIAATVIRCCPLRDLLPGRGFIKAVKLGCFNMPAVEEYDWG